jgi:hypothetical protein
VSKTSNWPKNTRPGLTRFSDAALKQKIAAHKRLGGYYNGNEIEEDKLLGHDVAVLRLVAQLPPAERETFARQNLSLYGRHLNQLWQPWPD